MGEPIGMLSGYMWFMLAFVFLLIVVFIGWLIISVFYKTNSKIPHVSEWWFIIFVFASVLITAGWSVDKLTDYEKQLSQEQSFDRIVKIYEFQWGFLFMDEDGAYRNELKVNPGEKILFKISSNDVIHGFNIPSLRITGEIEPGETYSYWIQAPEKPGEYVIQCTEYCGIGHYQMKGKIIVGGE